ncbi:hypothetical protein C0992_008249, partial [Termitomyces sp. T32_za158]
MKKDLYLHIAIKDIIRNEFFVGKKSFGIKNFDDFTSSHADHPEPELPISMVALVATAIHAALSKWDKGIKKTMSFDTDSYQEVYRHHVQTLEQYHGRHPLEFHRIMSTLFQAVT